MNSTIERQMREMNELLLVASVRQHELASQAASAEAALRQSEAWVRLALDAADLGIWNIDPATSLFTCDERFRAIFGTSVDGLTAEQALAHVHSGDRDRVTDAVAAATRPDDPAPYEVEYRVVHPDGSIHWVQAKGRATFENEGSGARLLSFGGTVADVTERKGFEQNLRDSEIRYRRLFQSAKDGIILLDAHSGKITDANAFMCGMLGLNTSEVLGRELYEIGMFKDIEENKAAFRQLQEDRYLRHDHLPVRNRRGEEVEVEFIANVYLESDKLMAQCNVRDIAERSRMEKQIGAQTAALADLARRKDEFLATLSHELRNPLAPIRSAVHLLKLHEKGNGDPIQRQAREIIERQVGNLTKLISDLLEVSRVVSGRVRLDLHPVDLRQAVEHALQTVAPLIEQHKHAVVVNHCPDPVLVLADSTRLEEILVNVLSNAAKYTPNGGRIEVDCQRPREGDKHHGLVRVRDNGMGIEKELLPHIFDLFTQADRSLARSAGGLGIGLSLAHRLVDLHGGTIEARSEGPGKGAEFIVRLPLMPADEPQWPATPPEPSPQAEGVRVLLVDDNMDQVVMLAMGLRHQGFAVRTACTGPEGLEAAREWQPDIVLLDIGLPGMDGYEVVRRLRADPSTHGMRLIAMTGYGQPTDVILALEAGFDAHLTKPFEFEELHKLMASPQH